MSKHDLFTNALIATMVLNAIVSIAIACSACYSPRQKIMQIGLVWILPVVGAIVFGLFLFSQYGSSPATGYPSQDEDYGTGKVALHYRDKNP